MLENKYEKLCWEKDEYVMGIDEVGRGPLCGPLVVACCVFPINYENPQIDDSKKLTEKKREALFKQIIHDAHHYEFRIVSPKEIDRYDIYHATQRAMDELSRSTSIHSLTVTDAMPLHRYDVIDMVKGDAKSVSVAGASILAKVLRDHIMMGYDVLYPQYEYRNHKGYGTKRHLQLMDEYGINELYRLSFRPCRERQMKLF
ncbi:MAG: ribonuclease HII [Erysipelotrichaceae bacterium]|nr:ribonuclease HII [Erysipelotrichaceae bacterium]MBQ1482533.1 ribonuclease HII [Erysipelotrichaceae bacterium]